MVNLFQDKTPMKFPLLYFMLLTFGTCLGQSSQMDLKTYFSESEIMDLNLITDFFQSEFCGNTDRTKFGSCITSSLPKLNDWEYKYLRKKISWKKQKKLYSKISDSTFNKIWAICNSTFLVSKPKYEHKMICFSQNPVILSFVKALGKSNRFLGNYAEKLEIVGGFNNINDISISLVDHSEEWNLKDRNIQIFLAIQYLTQNDMLKRDRKVGRLEKRYTRELSKKSKKTVPNNG
ncbi:Hypothetical protein I595_3684 [Croceitalea dokdonensis DOKDO 023]|uniref:Uncharacterized protein n=1 Tax=Croceitalea dokdonensis DOKDO 023 TaxID=1300341 RepID=A0A0P7AMD1_9FLAO|nr:hypothetical protein [Croceitalea dokdonensis]KPM30207.1 Hypothetical protein I595_3684 [Croceitalea dokdonensis DOKDO 023]